MTVTDFPLISVLIPMYNAEKYISDCLDSIINQTYSNLDIIIVNDGSTDRSVDICQVYADKDSRIRIIHQENQGTAEARNIAMNHMEGDFFTFFDNDDMMLPHFIEIMYSEMSDDVDIVCMNLKSVDEGKTYSQIKNYFYDKGECLIFTGKDSFKELSYMQQFKVSVHGKLFRREHLGDIRSTSFFHDDVGNTYKFFLKARKVVKIQSIGYVYRLSPGSLMRSSFTQKKKDVFDMVDNVLLNIKDEDLLPYANLLLFNNLVTIYSKYIDLFNPFKRKLRHRISKLAKGTEGISRPHEVLESYQKSPFLFFLKRDIRYCLRVLKSSENRW